MLRRATIEGLRDRLWVSRELATSNVRWLVRGRERRSWIQTVHRECLDHFVACGERHLDFLITEFLRHYHEQRPHQGVGNRLSVREPRRPGIHPSSPPIRAGPDAAHVPRVVCRKSLGGVLKHYERKVA